MTNETPAMADHTVEHRGQKRALILAGGGQKVAFQAGVLQVWLDEAHIDFHIADGASGGVLNLVQWCAGRSGSEIADNWRAMRPVKSIDVDWRQLFRGPYARSLFKLDKFRNVLRDDWDIDWPAITRPDGREVTFNVYNFTEHRLETIAPSDMDEDLLIAGISLPFWFPPVEPHRLPGLLYIDAVYALDANLDAAIAAGANELWVIWTVSEGGRWRNGAIAEYFQSIEAAANSRFREALQRIDASNKALKEGRPSCYPHEVHVRVLRHEVPLHYLFAFSGDRIAEAVNLGVETARAWCREKAIPYQERAAEPHREHAPKISFRERAWGMIGGSPVSLSLLMEIDDVERFVQSPDHEGGCSGRITADFLGGEAEVLNGSHFNLLVEDKHDPDRLDRKLMLYRLFLSGPRGEFTLLATKTCDAGDTRLVPGMTNRFVRAIKNFWLQTTTFDVEVQQGWHDVGYAGPVVAAGQLHLTLLDFVHQMTTYRSPDGWRKGLAAIGRFDRMFVSHLWDVYAANVLSSSPF